MVRRKRRRRLVVEFDDLEHHERVCNGNVSDGEAAGGHIVRAVHERLETREPAERPFRIILGRLWQPPLGLLEPGVAKDNRLREGQRRLAAMERVEIGAVSPLLGPHGKRRAGVAIGEVFRSPPIPSSASRRRS